MRTKEERPKTIVRPKCEAEIVEIINSTLSSSERAKAVGSRGSKMGCYLTSGTSINLCNHSRPLSVQGNLVTVEAGIRVADLNLFLWGHGLSLPTICEWSGPTIGGAVSTGSHSGSLVHGTMASSVSRIRLIDGRGEILELSKGEDLFNKFIISFGRLGVFTTVTLECEKSFYLEMEELTLPFDEFVDSYDEHCQSNEFYSAVWLPSSDQVVHFAGNRVPGQKKTEKRSYRFNKRIIASEFLSKCLSNRVSLFRNHEKKVSTGRSYEMLAPINTSPIMVRGCRELLGQPIEVEFAIPYDTTKEALSHLDRLFRDRRLGTPIGVRSSPPEPFAFSPCFERTTTWIAIFFACVTDTEKLLKNVVEIMCRFSARSHWGKHCPLPITHIASQYPNWSSFKELISIHDPNNIFQNDCSRRLLL